MVTSSRRGRRKASLGGVVLLRCRSLILLQEEQMPKGARTIAEHRSWHALVWTWLVALLLEDLGPDLQSDELSWRTSSLLLN